MPDPDFMLIYQLPNDYLGLTMSENTRQDLENRIDELARLYADTRDPKAKAELDVLNRRLAVIPRKSLSVQEVFQELTSDNYFNDPSAVPQPPRILEDQLKTCRDNHDFSPILFEWYKFVGLLTIFFAQLDRRSPSVKQIDPREYHILVGLLTRCSRLMLANVALSHEGVFGETTAIVDRCIFESAVKIMWLVNSADKERFRRFLADGLK